LTASNLHSHDIEDHDNTQITVYAGRGLLCESEAGRIWLVGTGVEHHTKYQYQFANTKNIWMGQIQTETPYYQPNPPAPYPFNTVHVDLHDPDFAFECNGVAGTNDTWSNGTTSTNFTVSAEPTQQLPGSPPCAMAWGLRIINSTDIYVYGAGLYSFFNNYNTACCQPGSGGLCQARMVYVGGLPRASGLTPAEASGTSTRDVELYNLNVIGSESMISRDGVDIARYEDNVAGFTACIALFRYQSDQGRLGFASPGAGFGSGSRLGHLSGRDTENTGSGLLEHYGPGPGSPIQGCGAADEPSFTPGQGPPGPGLAPSGGGGPEPTSSDRGYMCMGNWQQLCGPTAVENGTAAPGENTPVPSGGGPSLTSGPETMGWIPPSAPPTLGSSLPAPPAPETTCD